MAKWGFWDWVSYGCLGISALGLAVKAALDSNPVLFSRLPAFFTNPTWSYVPIILVVLGTIILVVRYAPSLPDGLSQNIEREFVDLTVEDLTSLVKGHTVIQAKKLSEVYVDKWMKVTGKVVNVQPVFNNVNLVMVRHRENQDIIALFKPKWTGRTSVLKVDQTITLIGKIKNVRSFDITLEECELQNTEIVKMSPNKKRAKSL